MSWVLSIDQTDFTRVDDEPRYSPGLVVQRLIPWRVYGTTGQGASGTELSPRTQMEQLKYVQYIEGGAGPALADDMTYYGSGAYDQYTVTNSNVDTVSIPAGALVSDVSGTKYCWIWIYGTQRIGSTAWGAAPQNSTGVGAPDGLAANRTGQRQTLVGFHDDFSGGQVIGQGPD